MTDPSREDAASSTAHRATGASLAAIILVSAGFAAVVALHMLRTDLDPVREVMSGYANGDYGLVMTIAFYALGVASLLMAWRLVRATSRTVPARAVSVLLVLGGLGLIGAGIFEVERPLVPDTLQEVIHSDAAIAAFVLLITAMLLSSWVCWGDPRWRSFFWVSLVLGLVATLGAAFSPIADKTVFTGVAQRLLGGTVFLWLLLVAVRVRFQSRFEPAPVEEAV